MIGIIFALDKEIEGVLDHIENCKTEYSTGYTFYIGTVCDKSIVAVRGGVGKVNIALCTELMILRYSPELIINTGVAGSLTDGLSILDVAIAKRCLQHDVDTTGVGDPIGMVSTVNRIYFPTSQPANEVIAKACESIGAKYLFATIATGDQFITDGAKKAWIRDTFSGEVCDMESCAIAQVCLINNIPCSFIRVISDSTDGNHGMEYSEFMPKAARKAVDVLVKALAEL